MIKSAIYKCAQNYTGQVDFMSLGSLVRSAAPFMGAALSYDLAGRSIRNVTREAREITLTVGSNNKEALNRAVALMEADAAEGTPGTIFIDGWQARACCVAVDVDEDNYRWRYIADFKVVLVDGSWKRAHLSRILKIEPDSQAPQGLDFPHGYEYDYSKDAQVARIESPAARPSKITLTIYGTAVNPRITIANNIYAFDVVVPDGSRLVCDASSADKTIKLITAEGIETDCLDKGRRTSGAGGGQYCFQTIPQGTHVVQYDGTFSFDVELWEERGGLPWI